MAATPELTAQVSDLLAQSSAAHLDFRANCARMQAIGGSVEAVPENATAALAALTRARDLRQQALAADPDLTSPVWTKDALEVHALLMAFYADEIGRRA